MDQKRRNFAQKLAYVGKMLYLCGDKGNKQQKLTIMEAVVYNTAEEKRSARNRLIVIKTAIEEQMRQRMAKMEW